MTHTITITTMAHNPQHESVPYLFAAWCSCNKWNSGFNAPKWTLLEIQNHWIESSLTNSRGLLHEEGIGYALSERPPMTEPSSITITIPIVDDPEQP